MIKEVLGLQAAIIVTIVIIVLFTKFQLTHILTAVNGLVASYSTDVRGTVSAKKHQNYFASNNERCKKWILVILVKNLPSLLLIINLKLK